MIKKMTKKAVELAVAENKIDVNLKISAKDVEPDRTPGTVGICETKNGNFMVYMVNENGRMYNTSVHDNRRIANGRVFERLMAANA